MALYDTRKKYIGRGGTGPADLFLPGYGEQDAPPVAVSRVGRDADGIWRSCGGEALPSGLILSAGAFSAGAKNLRAHALSAREILRSG